MYQLDSMFLHAQMCVFCSPSLVKAELRAVVQTHVGVAEQAAGGLPQGRGVDSAQLLLRQAEVAAHLGTRLHLGDVEAVLASWVRSQKYGRTFSNSALFLSFDPVTEVMICHLPGRPCCQRTASR